MDGRRRTRPIILKTLGIDGFDHRNRVALLRRCLESLEKSEGREALQTRASTEPLLRANLKQTVTERFRRAMEHARFADELHWAGKGLRSQRKWRRSLIAY